MIIDAISDLHGHYPKLEGGDLLIVAGDLTARDYRYEYDVFFEWIQDQDYIKKIVIGGNHDNLIQQHPEYLYYHGFDYLCDSATEFEWHETEDTKWGPKHLDGCRSLKLKIWGSPWTKTFEGMNPHCKSFTLDTEEELVEKWALIPDDVNILVTHSPPWTILDSTTDDRQVGSTSLLAELMTRIRPRLHIFGHIHESYGKVPMWGGRTLCVNASHVNEKYQPVNKTIRVIL